MHLRLPCFGPPHPVHGAEVAGCHTPALLSNHPHRHPHPTHLFDTTTSARMVSPVASVTPVTRPCRAPATPASPRSVLMAATRAPHRTRTPRPWPTRSSASRTCVTKYKGSLAQTALPTNYVANYVPWHAPLRLAKSGMSAPGRAAHRPPINVPEAAQSEARIDLCQYGQITYRTPSRLLLNPCAH